MRKFLTILFAGIFLLALAAFSYAKDQKTAYVDLDKVFEEYNKTKEEYKSLDDKLKAKEAERKKMVDEVRRLKDELELMSDKGKEQKQAAIDEKINTLSEFDRKAKDEFKKERVDAIRDISTEIDKVIQDYGKSQDYDYIYSSRALVFGKDEYDMTPEIIKILNGGKTAGGTGKKD
ncbi:MAG: OmpH family outer membrane protein [Candidatus Omnitrophica bacterium]|nr:OmpH family outer membrane protein [Candidatus Omnitrophota bacterium]